jgi:cell division protease FtsH
MWNFRGKTKTKLMLIVGGACVAAGCGLYVVLRGDPSQVLQLDYTTLMSHAKSGDVKEVSFDGARIAGELTSGAHFTGEVPNGATQAALADRLAERGIAVRFASSGGVDPVQVATTLVMAISLGGLLFVLVRKNPGAFGTEARKAVNLETSPVKFIDVDGVDEAKNELQEIVQFLKTPERFTRLGGRIPRGVLLVGPPGTGKTLLARAVAGEAGVPFYAISGSEFVEMFVGVGARRVRNLFAQARKAAPCIVFIDEVDAIGRQRGGPSNGHNEEREQALNQLLVEMDGFDQHATIVVMAATNRHDVLDEALLRPGRFDRRVTVDRPDIRGRRRILEVHTRGTPLFPDVDLHKVARGTPGMTGAELANLVNEAALSAAREGREEVRMADFETARDKVTMGVERTSAVMTEPERERIAIHEAGHALAAFRLPAADPVHKVSIIPRGSALGITMQLPDHDRNMYSREYLESQIAVLMAGRVAEERMLGSFASGSANDIERATSIARKMVRQLGMSRIGPVVCLERGAQGGRGDFLSEYSVHTELRIDEEVERILSDGLRTAQEIVGSDARALEALRQVLLEEETIDHARFACVVAAAGLEAA